MVRDPYDVLGVAPDASAEELRAAWRQASRRTHPDLGGSAAAFREVRDAYRAITSGEAGADADPVFVWPVGLSEVASDRWGWRPPRPTLVSLAILLCLLVMVAMLLAPAVLVTQGQG